MDVNADTIKATADLANALSQFRTNMFIALCVTVVTLGLGGAFMFFWFRRATLKDQARAEAQQKVREGEMEAAQKTRETEMEEAKKARATLYTQAQLEQAKSLATLAVVIQTTHDAATAMHQSTNKTLSDLGTTIARNSQALSTVASAVQRMTDKVDGKLSREDSRKFVAAKLNADMCRAICNIIEKSFVENHFLGREDFIANRIRSRTRDVLVATRAELIGLPLAVTVDPYFPTLTDDLGERFVLCDQIWSKVAALFADARAVEPRLEEATQIVENLIKDHIARVAKRDSGSDVFDASGAPMNRGTDLLTKLVQPPVPPPAPPPAQSA